MIIRHLTVVTLLLSAVYLLFNSSPNLLYLKTGSDPLADSGDDVAVAMETLYELHCSQLKTYSTLSQMHGYIPNSWNGRTANLVNNKGADLMVQPRMLQYSMNALLANDYLGMNFSKCVDDVLENTLMGIKRFSSDYVEPLPWKKTPDFQDKTDEPMNVYDIGDWLMVVSVAAMVSGDPEVTLYLQKVVEKTSQLLGAYVKENRFPDRFTYGYQPSSHPLEVGHATLLIDGLLYAYLATGNIEMLSISKAFYNTVSQPRRSPIFEKMGGENNYTTLMTYGELLESTNLLYFITADDFYLTEGKRISAEMLDEFTSSNFKLSYRKEITGKVSPCNDAMGLEAAVYQSLNFYRSEMTEEELATVFNYIKSFTDEIPENGYVPQVLCNDNSHNNLFLIGNQYGLLKTLYYIKNTPSLAQEAKKHGINAKRAIRLIIDKLASSQLTFGLPNALSDEEAGIITDPGGNVWMFNEAIMPILIEYKFNLGLFNLDKMRQNKHGLVGCNYLFLTV